MFAISHVLLGNFASWICLWKTRFFLPPLLIHFLIYFSALGTMLGTKSTEIWTMRPNFIFDMFELQVQQAESGMQGRGKIWMSFDLTSAASWHVLWFGAMGDATSTATSKTHFEPVMMLMIVTWWPQEVHRCGEINTLNLKVKSGVWWAYEFIFWGISIALFSKSQWHKMIKNKYH